jgi:hypothetical protein
MEHTVIYYLHRGDNIPFYIGKSKKYLERLENHKQVYGPNIQMFILDIVEDWRYWEKYYIQKYKELGYILENKNSGGGGPEFVSQETINKIKNHPTRAKKISKARVGRPMKHKGKPFSEEHKAKIKATRDFLKSRKNIWQQKPVIQLDLEGNFIREFGSQSKAQYFMGKYKSDGVGACCRGEQKTAYGYRWEYKNN